MSTKCGGTATSDIIMTLGGNRKTLQWRRRIWRAVYAVGPACTDGTWINSCWYRYGICVVNGNNAPTCDVYDNFVYGGLSVGKDWLQNNLTDEEWASFAKERLSK